MVHKSRLNAICRIRKNAKSGCAGRKYVFCAESLAICGKSNSVMIKRQFPPQKKCDKIANRNHRFYAAIPWHGVVWRVFRRAAAIRIRRRLFAAALTFAPYR